MNYPVWELGVLGGGFWIALIAIVHVFVAHFAVGGGLWLVTTLHRARRRDDAALLAYIKGHSKFFLLLTMVFGGPNHYTGQDLREGHKHLVERGLDDSHVDAVIELLGETLQELGANAADIEEVAAIANSARDDVLNR